jgi:hypothetical protein
MTTLLTVMVLTLIGGLMFELHERRAERLERLNRESWEVLQTARRIHDEAAEALQADVRGGSPASAGERGS